MIFLAQLSYLYQEFLEFISESSLPCNPIFFLLIQDKYCYEHTETEIPKYSTCYSPLNVLLWAHQGDILNLPLQLGS